MHFQLAGLISALHFHAIPTLIAAASPSHFERKTWRSACLRTARQAGTSHEHVAQRHQRVMPPMPSRPPSSNDGPAMPAASARMPLSSQARHTPFCAP